MTTPSFSRSESSQKIRQSRADLNRHIGELAHLQTELTVIHKTQLRPHPEVQRIFSHAHANAILKKWEEASAGVLVVVLRENGEMFVIDGQHRLWAAMQRTDFHYFNCLVITGATNIEEAILWRRYNIERKNPGALDRFHNAVREGQPNAAKINKFIEKIGRIVPLSRNSDSKTVVCVSTIEKLMQSFPEETEKVFPLVGEVCEGHVFDESIIKAFVYLETKLDNDSLMSPKWSSRIKNIGYVKIRKEITETVGLYKKNTNRLFAVALLNAINYGLRHKLIVPGLNDD